MKSSSKRRVRTLRAKASTVDPAEFEDYGPEPNMKLSHAFMVVLALHIIAVGGLFAFNKVKATHVVSSTKPKIEKVASKEIQQQEEGSSKSTLSQSLVAPATTVNNTSVVKSGGALVAPAEAPTSVTPATASAPAVVASTIPVVASTTTTKEYTIVKGDNPYKLAKRFHVTYDALIKYNNITDPRKIQIGQKLKIPAATIHKTTTVSTHKVGKHK